MHVANFFEHHLTSWPLFIEMNMTCKGRVCQADNKWESSMTQLIMEVHDIYFVCMRYHSFECDLNNAWKCILIRLLHYYIWLYFYCSFLSQGCFSFRSIELLAAILWMKWKLYNAGNHNNKSCVFGCNFI